MLHGLDLLEASGMYVKNVENVMVNNALGYSSLIYLEFPAATMLITKSELIKLHLQLKHPNIENFMSLRAARKSRTLTKILEGCCNRSLNPIRHGMYSLGKLIAIESLPLYRRSYSTINCQLT